MLVVIVSSPRSPSKSIRQRGTDGGSSAQEVARIAIQGPRPIRLKLDARTQFRCYTSLESHIPTSLITPESRRRLLSTLPQFQKERIVATEGLSPTTGYWCASGAENTDSSHGRGHQGEEGRRRGASRAYSMPYTFTSAGRGTRPLGARQPASQRATDR